MQDFVPPISGLPLLGIGTLTIPDGIHKSQNSLLVLGEKTALSLMESLDCLRYIHL
jgi:hypothetical protein